MKHTAKVFEVEESPCCARRIRIRLGDKSLCLSLRESKDADRVLRTMINQIRSQQEDPPVQEENPC